MTRVSCFSKFVRSH